MERPEARSGDSEDSGPSPAQLLLHDAAAVVAFLEHYFTAKVDGIRLAVRKYVIRIALSVLAGIAVVALGIEAVGFVLSGVSGLFSEILGSERWLGDLCAGVLALAILIGAIAFFLAWRRHVRRRRALEKYEQLRDREKQRALAVSGVE